MLFVEVKAIREEDPTGSGPTISRMRSLLYKVF